MIKGRVWKADTMELVTILLKKEISEANIYKSVRVWNGLGGQNLYLISRESQEEIDKQCSKNGQ